MSEEKEYIYKSYSDLVGMRLRPSILLQGFVRKSLHSEEFFVEYLVNYDKTYVQRIHITPGLPGLPQRLGCVWGGSKLYMF